MKNLKLEFRAWDGKKMHQYKNSALVLGTKHTIYHKPVGKGEFLVSKMCTTENAGIIMQFIGAEDKDGTPIYGGDILSELVECDGKMVESNQPVFYNVKAFAWCIDISFNKDRSSFEFLHEINLMNYRVVGNIHQDSDLLKTK